MTELELLKIEIAELKAKVAMLEVRPIYVPTPAPYPIYPFNPWQQPYITCGAYSTTNTTTSSI
jgi:hypothetical protein